MLHKFQGRQTTGSLPLPWPPQGLLGGGSAGLAGVYWIDGRPPVGGIDWCGAPLETRHAWAYLADLGP
jgi:hypothetical protein